jgi:hypothetical protein
MFKPTKATSVSDYLTQLPLERKKTVEFLHVFIERAAPGLAPYFAYNMLGYGSFQYKNYKNQMIDWPIIALANQKNYISIYICAVQDDKYLAERYKDQLGKVSVGKSCIRLKKLDDINLEVLAEVIQIAAKKPGLI